MVYVPYTSWKSKWFKIEIILKAVLNICHLL